ncbi:MAG: zinc-dependent metalloprotease, partial [Gemmatimonadota bacterium]
TPVLALAALTLGAAACIAPRGAPGRGPGPDSAREDEDEGPKPYDEVVTEEAVTDSGLFHLHRVDSTLLFEIPDSILEREILLVTRTARTPTNLGYGGLKANTQTLRFHERRDEDEVLLRIVSYENVAADSLPIYEAVRNANFEPILESFDIAAYNEDSTTVVLDVTPLFTEDEPMLGLGRGPREVYDISSLDESRSYIQSARSFPRNVEVRHVLTYSAQNPPSNPSTGSITVEMNQSMILLPERPMQPRLWDERVGFFRVSQVDYGRSDQKVVTRRYVTRWRLEPSDTAAFRRGELVEPVKQIVYYIDPATPEKWRPYLKAGIEDWNAAFERAGFRNAIQGRMPPSPEEDPEFSPEDVRYSVIRWFPSEVQNAFGPHVHDPRSGEILESDIGWFHNVANLLRNWYFVQTAAANPEARRVHFDDEVMGKLIRFVAAHEVGHTLGLPHNMKASAAFPVDSLRAPGFVCRNGVAPSIMDYARFNYVAQPGDERVCFDPRVGEYDKYAIAWGYRPILDAATPDEEKATLNEWILEHEGDPVYYFGDPSGLDPTSLTEAIGADAMEAGRLGIENLKRIVPNLIEWTRQDGEDYSELDELYDQVIAQWNRYMGHVATNIGGVTRTRKAFGQEGPVYEFVPEETQRRAMRFFDEQGLEPPVWMVDETILSRIENPSTVERMRGLQVGVVNRILDPGRMQRLIEAGVRNGGDAYDLGEMLGDLREAVWRELSSGEPIGVYRRNLQRGYLERLEFLMTFDITPIFAFGDFGDFFTRVDVSQSDIRPFVRGELETLRAEIRRALARGPERPTRLHLEDALVRIDDILDPEP